MTTPINGVTVLLREESEVCPTGGGFTKTEWFVHVHDGWMNLGTLIKRKRVGSVSVAVEFADDPHGEGARGHWVDRPAGVYYRIEVRVRAPIGTRFRSRTWTPVRDPKRPVWFERSDAELELRGEDRLVSPRVLAERAARKAHPEPLPAPLPKEEARRFIGDLLSKLGPEPTPGPTRKAAPPDGPLPPDTSLHDAQVSVTPTSEAAPPVEPFVRSRRHRPVELQARPSAPVRRAAREGGTSSSSRSAPATRGLPPGRRARRG